MTQFMNDCIAELNSRILAVKHYIETQKSLADEQIYHQRGYSPLPCERNSSPESEINQVFLEAAVLDAELAHRDEGFFSQENSPSSS